LQKIISNNHATDKAGTAGQTGYNQYLQIRWNNSISLPSDLRYRRLPFRSAPQVRPAIVNICHLGETIKFHRRLTFGTDGYHSGRHRRSDRL